MSLIDEAASIINDVVCPVCKRTIKVTLYNSSKIEINHNKTTIGCNDFENNLLSSYWATIDGTISIQKLKSVAGKQ